MFLFRLAVADVKLDGFVVLFEGVCLRGVGIVFFFFSFSFSFSFSFLPLLLLLLLPLREESVD
jgi:hypothetical protein